MSRISVVRCAARLLPRLGALVALVLATPGWATGIRRSRDEPAETLDPGLNHVAYRRTWDAFPGARRRLREQLPELHARAFGRQP